MLRVHALQRNVHVEHSGRSEAIRRLLRYLCILLCNVNLRWLGRRVDLRLLLRREGSHLRHISDRDVLRASFIDRQQRRILLLLKTVLRRRHIQLQGIVL